MEIPKPSPSFTTEKSRHQLVITNYFSRGGWFFPPNFSMKLKHTKEAEKKKLLLLMGWSLFRINFVVRGAVIPIFTKLVGIFFKITAHSFVKFSKWKLESCCRRLLTWLFKCSNFPEYLLAWNRQTRIFKITINNPTSHHNLFFNTNHSFYFFFLDSPFFYVMVLSYFCFSLFLSVHIL